MRPDTAHLLLARVARAQRDGRLPSLVAGVVADGRLDWSAGRGRVGDAPPDADTQYRIGSITKTFTAVLVLRLRDEGRLELDDPVERHLPELSLGGRTIGQLLTHGGGLRAETHGEWWERVDGVDWPALAATLGEQSLVFPAGRRFHYSNLGYAVLGHVAATLRSRPWADCITDEILQPLGMTRTTLLPAAPHARGFAVHPHADLLLDEPLTDTRAMAPAGQLWSTVNDLARFVRLLLGDAPEVLAADTVLEMSLPGPVDDTRGDWSSYGLGVQVWRVDGRLRVGHGGSMPGFLAGLVVEPADRTAVLALANATSGLDGTMGLDLLDIVRDREPLIGADWRPAADLDESLLPLLGPWYWGSTPFVLRLAPDGQLELAPAGAGRAARFRRVGSDWIGQSGYYAGERLTGTAEVLDIGTFVFTRTPYPSGAVTPGGVTDGWRVAEDTGPDPGA